MQWYSLPMIMTDKSAVIFFTNDNDRQMQVIFFTNDNDRQMQWYSLPMIMTNVYSLPMIMTDKCSDILYQW